MENILMLLIVGILMILAFLFGARTAQKAYEKEEIIIPTPTNVIKDIKDELKEKKEQKDLNTMLENINNYSGDGLGQKDFK